MYSHQAQRFGRSPPRQNTSWGAPPADPRYGYPRGPVPAPQQAQAPQQSQYPSYPQQYGAQQPQYPPQQQYSQQPFQQQQYPQQQYPQKQQQQAYPHPYPPQNYGDPRVAGPGMGMTQQGFGMQTQAQPQPARPMPNAAAAISSTYASQAARWKEGFKNTAPSGASKRSGNEVPLVAELCSSAGSSYPPREVLQKLLRRLGSLDHEYLCELLNDKLEDTLWQVQGKALSVLDALIKSPSGEFFKDYYYHRLFMIERLCHAKKELLRVRADKVFKVLKEHVPAEQPEPIAQDQDLSESASVVVSESTQPAPQEHAPDLMTMMEPAPPAPIQADPEESSGFSFLKISAIQTPPSPPTQEAVVSATVPADPVAPAPAPAPLDLFSTLAAPVPIVGIDLTKPNDASSAPEAEKEVEEDKERDPFDAFNDLHVDEGTDDSTSIESPKSASMDGSIAPSKTSVEPQTEWKDPVREVFFDIDVPAGPMGLVLDQSISQLAVVERFISLPTGERGYLEMHPVLCPGCQLIGINNVNVEENPLEEIGPMLGSLLATRKVLRFRKMIRGGRTLNPAEPDSVYVPPPLAMPEPAAEEDEDSGNEAADPFTAHLNAYRERLDSIEQHVEDLASHDHTSAVGDKKNELAQLHGTLEKIQTQGIDAVILGPNPPPNADEIKQFRSSLVQRCDALAHRIQTLANPLVEAPAPAPAPVPASAFSFLTEASASSPASTTASSGFSFLQSSVSSASSPKTNQTANSSAFSFLQNSTSPSPSQQPPKTSSSGFSFMAQQTETPTDSSAPTTAPSAFSFLQPAASSSSAPSSPEPPSTSAPASSAFGFLSN